jgi:hypothetical protein
VKRLLLLLTAAAIGCGGGGESTAPITAPPSDTTQAFPGFDIGVYPGDGALAAWKYPASPYRWVGYYLAAPCHRDTTFVGKRATITSMGWGLAAIYVGQQDWAAMPSLADRAELADLVTCSATLLSTAQGASEAADAVAKMRADGFVDGSVVYLDVEYVTAVSQPLLDYYRAWVSGVLADGHYKPGVYAAKSNAPTLYNVPITDPRGVRYTPPFWIAASSGFSITSRPTDVGLSFAQIWQGLFDVPQTFNGVTLRIDVDVAATPSPSAPR